VEHISFNECTFRIRRGAPIDKNMIVIFKAGECPLPNIDSLVFFFLFRSIFSNRAFSEDRSFEKLNTYDFCKSLYLNNKWDFHIGVNNHVRRTERKRI
jgi:hypothetical protein